MNTLSTQLPLSIIMYKRRTFSPKLYIKSDCESGRRNTFIRYTITSLSAVGAAFLLMTFLSDNNLLFFSKLF